MAVSSGFFNSINNDRLYNAEHFSKFFDGLITDGVYLQVGDKFHVDPGTGLAVNVGSGRGWFKRVWIYNDSTLELELTAADPILSRIDAIVIDVDASTNVRNAEIKVVTGTAATRPDKPTLIDEELNKQYPLAYVTVTPGATSLTNINIEDCLATGELPAVKALLDLDAEAIAEINERIAELSTAFAGGAPGLVPRSTENTQDKYLKGDGTWGTPSGGGGSGGGDHQVNQNAAGGVNSNLKVLLSDTNSSVNEVGNTKWDDDLRYNPSTNNLTVGSVNDVKLAKSGNNYGYYDANGNFKSFRQPTGDAVASNVLSGKTFSNGTSDGLTGSMANRGSLTATLYGPNDTYSYSAGYYSGGTITCKNYHDNNTYALTASETGVKDLGTYHNYRKVDASAPYSAGVAAGKAAVRKYLSAANGNTAAIGAWVPVSTGGAAYNYNFQATQTGYYIIVLSACLRTGYGAASSINCGWLGTQSGTAQLLAQYGNTAAGEVYVYTGIFYAEAGAVVRFGNEGAAFAGLIMLLTPTG